jgi:SAM-dependent methyltransferase
MVGSGAYRLGRRLDSAASMGSRVLDVGAGTGFLSLAAARLGYQVTALDLSAKMLERLEVSAAREGLRIDLVHARAEIPPPGPFDAVMERLLLWTLPDPAAALAAWRQVAPSRRLLAFEGLTAGRGYVEAICARARADAPLGPDAAPSSRLVRCQHAGAPPTDRWQGNPERSRRAHRGQRLGKRAGRTAPRRRVGTPTSSPAG